MLESLRTYTVAQIAEMLGESYARVCHIIREHHIKPQWIFSNVRHFSNQQIEDIRNANAAMRKRKASSQPAAHVPPHETENAGQQSITPRVESAAPSDGFDDQPATDITRRADQLPAVPDKLAVWILVGKDLLRARLDTIRAMSKAETALALKQAALADTQDLAEVLLDAERRLGEILAGIEPKRSRGSSTKATSLPSLPMGVSRKQSHQAQELYRHPEIVEAAKAKARETGSIVTSHQVLKAIRAHKRQQTQKHASAEVKADVVPAAEAKVEVMPAAEAKVQAVPGENPHLWLGDFKDLATQIEGCSVDHILTDLPCPAGSPEPLELLAAAAARVLRPGGYPDKFLHAECRLTKMHAKPGRPRKMCCSS
jgi:hypothetical protein